MNKKLLIVVALMAVVLVCLSACSFGNVSEVSEYIEGLEAQYDDGLMIAERKGIYSTYVDSEGYLKSFGSLVSGKALDVYCKYDGRVYFSFMKHKEPGSDVEIWSLASIREDSSDIRIIAERELNSDPDAVYRELTLYSDNSAGGTCIDGVIYLRGSDGEFAYNVIEGREVDPPEMGRYAYYRKNGLIDGIAVVDSETGEKRELDLGLLERNCEELQKVIKLRMKASGVLAPLEWFLNLPYNYIALDGELYLAYFSPDDITYEEAEYLMLFKYDFESDSLVYMCSMVTPDTFIEEPEFVRDYTQSDGGDEG